MTYLAITIVVNSGVTGVAGVNLGVTGSVSLRFIERGQNVGGGDW